MEILLLLIFGFGLLLCALLNVSILFGMVFGYILFFIYGLIKKHSVYEILAYSYEGVKTVKNILLMFIFVGILTALWRSCGSIAYIVYYASELFSPSAMVLITFLLCSLISFLMGTAFGSAATMGVICMTIGHGLGISPALMGGAILAGVYFGDRCSPVSTSALLVSELTKTEIRRNMGIMFKTALIPFIISCVIYFFACSGFSSEFISDNTQKVFSQNFNLSPLLLLPPIAVLIFSLLRFKVIAALAAGCLFGAACAFFIQNINIYDIAIISVKGFYPENEELAAIMKGGGIISMRRVFFIVCISSCFGGIFHKTGFLNNIRKIALKIADKRGNFFSCFITSVITSAFACNQTLAIILTHQLCEENYKDKYEFASHLENTAVIISPLIPWSIAGAVPLDSVNAPTISILCAFYLFLIPIYNLIINKIAGFK